MLAGSTNGIQSGRESYSARWPSATRVPSVLSHPVQIGVGPKSWPICSRYLHTHEFGDSPVANPCATTGGASENLERIGHLGREIANPYRAIESAKRAFPLPAPSAHD